MLLPPGERHSSNVLYPGREFILKKVHYEPLSNVEGYGDRLWLILGLKLGSGLVSC